MLDRVRPRFWDDPKTGDQYDMVVIGGGAAGMVTSASISILGGRAALIERNVIGGDCLYTGCVPSKAFLKASNIAHNVKNAAQYGIEVTEYKVNFPKVMERMRAIRAEISKADAAQSF